MAKRDQQKGAFSLQGFDSNHYKRTQRYVNIIERLYDNAIKDLSAIAVNLKVDETKPFTFNDYPRAKKLANEEFLRLANNITTVVQKGTREEWLYACKKNDEFLNSILNTSKIEKDLLERMQDRNLDALKTFQSRKVNGMNLSQRVWKYTEQFKDQIELGIDVGIGEGRSAAQLSRDIRQNLNDPDRLFRRVRDKRGNLHLSKNAKAFNPGQGVYRSSAKNALRLTRTEINMAYRESDHLRWKNLDFVVGFEIKVSNRHHEWLEKHWNKHNPGKKEICDVLTGKYPKWFKFTGWHPQCYSDDTSVLTKKGWKLFKEVLPYDMIFSLNPETRQPEWVKIQAMQKYKREGEMIHFHNRSLDCLVTPDHEMVYLNKSDGRIIKRLAKDYTKNHGAFYRGCEWVGNDTETITIGKHKFNMSDFAEFMGYWLSDGSLMRKSQIFISQQIGDPNRENIKDCIIRLGLTPKPDGYGVSVYSRDFNAYLKKFGLAPDKYVPEEIKNAKPHVISKFLKAFISCDGHIKKPKPFMGSRGTMCYPNSSEREYFTTSRQMASDIGELLLKIGKRPSYSIEKLKGKAHKFSNGTYTINHDLIRVRECKSITATAFNKDVVDYSGYVYDLTLEKNHIMYVQRNGKCFWGSNCMCYAIPILMNDQEFRDRRVSRLKAALKGDEYKKYQASNEIKDVPDNFKNWIEENAEKQKSWKSTPYFIRDNFIGGDIENGLKGK